MSRPASAPLARPARRIGRARAFVRYLKDPGASKLGKAFLVATLAYVVWPLDVIPDVPVVGWLDDLGIFSVASAFVWSRLGRYREASLEDAPDGEGAGARWTP